MQYVASISYGKDSLAMLHVIKDVLNLPLDRIVTAEVWATDTIQADLPPMVEFKDKADEIILERWGIKVERFCAVNSKGEKLTYEKGFYRVAKKSKYDYKNGKIWGFPYLRGPWCNSYLKTGALDRIKQTKSGETIDYLGIAADEGKRVEHHKCRAGIVLPLVDAGWTEAMCRKWCEDNGLLSPLYATSNRGDVGSATINQTSNCECSANNTRICGQSCLNGIQTRRITPSFNHLTQFTILTDVFSLRMKDITTIRISVGIR